jgi:hypothetical protein
MLLNYYGAFLSPVDLNSCLGPGADPIVWQSAPACTLGKVQGGERTDFSWDGLDAFLAAGKPVIVGMLRGLTGSHFVVVTQGGSGLADSYAITDPWDGSTTKTLGSYTNAGYNPRWIVSYDGPGKNCGRLVRSTTAPPRGFTDGGTYKNPVTVTVPNGGGDTTVQKVPSGGGTTPTSPSPSPSVSPSATPSTTPTVTPTATPSGGVTINIHAGGAFTFHDEGVYQVIRHHPLLITKFTIDHTPPVLSLRGLNLLTTGRRGFSAPAPTMVLARPGQLRLSAVDTLSGVDSIRYSLDHSDWTPYTDDVSFGRTLVVPNVGTHVISIIATDAAGNTADLDAQTFDVQDAAPSPSPSATPTPTPTAVPTRRPTAPPTTAPTPMPTPTPQPITASVSALSSSPVSGQLCPAKYVISGTISVTGGPGEVTFEWVHDGVVTSVSGVIGPGVFPETDPTVAALPTTTNALASTVQLVVLTQQPISSSISVRCIIIG